MANYHMEVTTISRGKGRSIARALNYITGERIYDEYNGRSYGHKREDVLFSKIFLPDHAPPEFCDLQSLCDEIDRAEVRYDARTAREFKGSLPNELTYPELTQIVQEFITHNFVDHSLCAIAAIHEGRNESDPTKNNPHAHIIVPTRTVGMDGFCEKKNREWDKKKYIGIWREDWANVQNRAYERNGLDVRVSHESLEVQGVRNREPTIHLSRADWQREMRGIHTPAGDRKREIQERNKARVRHVHQKERSLELELSR